MVHYKALRSALCGLFTTILPSSVVFKEGSFKLPRIDFPPFFRIPTAATTDLCSNNLTACAPIRDARTSRARVNHHVGCGQAQSHDVTFITSFFQRLLPSADITSSAKMMMLWVRPLRTFFDALNNFFRSESFFRER